MQRLKSSITVKEGGGREGGGEGERGGGREGERGKGGKGEK